MITLPRNFGRGALRKMRRKDAEQVLQDLEAEVDAAIAAGDTSAMERLLEQIFYSDDMGTADQVGRLRLLEDRLRLALGSEPLRRPWE